VFPVLQGVLNGDPAAVCSAAAARSVQGQFSGFQVRMKVPTVVSPKADPISSFPNPVAYSASSAFASIVGKKPGTGFPAKIDPGCFPG
jgi:hypothetical protein